MDMKVAVWSFEDVDREVWKVLENETSHLSVFQTYRWAKVLNSTGIEPIFFVLMDDKNPLVGLLSFKSRLLWGALCGYEARGGFLLSSRAQPIYAKMVLHALRKKARKERSLYAFVYPIPLIDFDRYFVESGYFPSPHATFIVDLKLPTEDLWKRLRKSARWGVRKSRETGIVVNEAKTWSEWEKWYTIYVAECNRLGLNSRSYGLHKAIYDNLVPKGGATLLVAELDSKIVAGSLFLTTRDEAFYYENASNPKYLRFDPNDALQWQAIMLAKDRGICYYDLGGTSLDPLKDSSLQGVHRFKEKWGGELHKYNFFNVGRLYSTGKHLTTINPSMRRLYYVIEKCGLIRRFDRVAG